MSLMQHVVSGTISVKTDGADESFLKVFKQYVANSLQALCDNLHVKVFSEVALIENEIQDVVPKNSVGHEVFVVNYFKDPPVSGAVGNVLTEKDKELSEQELSAARKLADSLKVPDAQIVGCQDASLAQAECIVFGGIEPRFQIKAIAEYYARGTRNPDSKVYAYAKSRWLADLLQGCHPDLKIFGNEQSLFRQSRVEQVAVDLKTEGYRTRPTCKGTDVAKLSK